MNSIFLIIIVVLLAVLLAVVAYNMYQENQYRQKIRHQFGHADQDALMNSQSALVRDGKTLFGKKRFSYVSDTTQPETASQTTESDSAVSEVVPDVMLPESLSEVQPFQLVEDDVDDATVFHEVPDEECETPHEIVEMLPENTQTNMREPLFDLNDLQRNDLLWFDKRFDFMAYVSLFAPKELHAIPRLSGRHRFQIIGCTMDGRFQAAEPIPGIAYQAFVIGLQAISRRGLAEKEELEHFSHQVQQFAQKMDGVVHTSDVAEFLKIAQPLDELCARVDQTIAIHLVSRATVLGTEVRNTLQKLGFVLLNDGTFALSDAHGDPKYVIAALDGSAFTEALLSSQPYKGFSMLFDLTRVPHAEESFNEFMTLAVRLSGELGLDLVDNQVQQLSTEWLKEVRTYVGARQAEMLKIGIEPNSELAKRLFS